MSKVAKIVLISVGTLILVAAVGGYFFKKSLDAYHAEAASYKPSVALNNADYKAANEEAIETLHAIKK